MTGRVWTVRVARREVHTDSVVAFDLVAAHAERLPAYRPGAHVDLHLPGGYTRSYSLAEAPHAAGLAVDRSGRATVARWRIGVLREAAGRGGSAAAHTRIAVGDLLPVTEPRCGFPMPSGDAPLLLLAGGIGLTPLLAMAQQAVRDGRPVALHVFVRRRDALPFPVTLGAPDLAPVTTVHTDDALAAGGRRPADVLGDLVTMAAADAAQVACCGPSGFLQTVARQAEAAGLPQERLHREWFAPPDGGTGAEAASAGEPFRLRLARQGGPDVVVAAGQTAVEALHDLGIDIPVSCRQGICGTCVVGWSPAAGAAVPQHRDHCLTAAERTRRVALCCARASPSDHPLVLDL
jgi:vanillate O-demethylase ferredoxin subunit